MVKFKKVLRSIILIILIVLAGFGVGLSGGVTIPSFGRSQERNEFEISVEKEADNEEEVKP